MWNVFILRSENRWSGLAPFAIRAFLVMGLAFVSGTAQADEPPQVTARVDRDELYQGESITYRVRVINVPEPIEPGVEHFEGFRLENLDEQTRTIHITRVRNGVSEQLIRKERTHIYRLTPEGTGKLTIPPPVIELADGTRLEGNDVTINVVAIEPQDAVFVEAEVTPKRAYLSQKIQVTLTVGVQALPGDAARENPMKLYVADPFGRRDVPRAPELMIPWFDDELVPSQLHADVGMAELFSQLYNDDGAGFQINHIGRDRVGSLLRMSSLLAPVTVFQPTPTKTERTDAQGRKRTYWQYTFTRQFTAQDIGVYSFQPATLNGVFVGLNDDNRPVARRVFLVSDPLSVEVVDAPRKGRPASYTGAIGKFELSSRLSAEQAHVGEPLELEVTVRGTGSLHRIAPIDLALQHGVHGRFRFHEPTERTTDDARLFTYRIRPQSASVTHFPGLEMAYFDVEREEFVTLRTPDIPLSVLPSDRLTNQDIVASQAANGAGSEREPASTAGASAADARPPLMDVSQLRYEDVRWPRWIAAWSSMLTAYALVCVLVVRRRRRVDPARQRRRHAATQARRGQRAARELAGGGQTLDAFRTLRATLLQLIADYSGAPAAGMTTHDARHQLTGLGVEPDLVQRVADWLEAGDAVQYAPGRPSDALLDDGQELLRRLVKHLETSSGLAESARQ